MKVLFNRLYALASDLLMMASFEHQSPSRKILRRLFCLHPIPRAVLLYQGGFIHAAKKITDKYPYKNPTMQRITARINCIDLALTRWDEFVSKVAVPGRSMHASEFNDTVLMVVNSCSKFDQNGYAVRSAQLGKALTSSGIDVTFCARLGYPWDMHGRENWPIENMAAGDEGAVVLKHDPDWLVGGPDVNYWWAYANHIKKTLLATQTRPGVLHAHSKYSNAIAAVIAGRELGIPVIYEMRGLWHLTRAQREPTFHQSAFFQYEEQLEVWAAELADAVVVISDTLKTWLIERGISKHKISVIPNAVDLSGWQSTPDKRSFSCPQIRLAFMGSLTPYEGVDTVMEALKILISSGHTATLDIFGDGRSRQSLQDLSARLNLHSAVTFHGRVNKDIIREQIDKFDFFPIIRKDSELTRLIPPLKQLDPMLHGRVVLISALPALLANMPECIGEVAVPPDDPAALARQIQQLALQPARMQLIGEQSGKWVVAERNWQHNALAYAQLYARICNAN